ncbi:hypothetical protein DFH06DRAFT_748006 [Mycena polygramma]|nr:hypothetical protein DFH06DRAFT_748006 [Mycena polygramma]
MRDPRACLTSAPGGPVTIRCHRCKTIGVECSFETSDLFHFVPKTTSGSPATSGEHSGPASAATPDAPLNALAAVASSRENAAEVTMNQIRGQHRFKLSPEDLLPTAATPIWGSVSRDDWTATPMLAIQELVRCPTTSAPQIPAVADSLSDILSPPEITSLLEIFESRYAPWLCIEPGSLESSNSLLDTVRCTIASRPERTSSRILKLGR